MDTPPLSTPDARLERLAANARLGQWSIDTAIDWDQTRRIPFWISKAQVRKAVSQLYHGELATSRLCALLLKELDQAPARRCVEMQHRDEERHAEAYRLYLEPIGGVAPMDANLAQALNTALDGPFGTLGAMVAYHVVVEGEVLRIQGMLASLVPCPLLKRINRLVARDEARHVAFGRIYLGTAVADLTPERRRQLGSWIQGHWSMKPTRPSSTCKAAAPSCAGSFALGWAAAGRATTRPCARLASHPNRRACRHDLDHHPSS